MAVVKLHIGGNVNTYEGVTLENPRGDSLQTFRGGLFYAADPKPSEVNIRDIAHALSLQCRYGGHCEKFYSVAEHSYLVSYMVPPEDALAALLHDATEAYVVDMPRPVKALLPEYRALEARVWAAVAETFGLPLALPDSVKQADNDILISEREQNMKAPACDWGIPDRGVRVNLRFWTPQFAERMFLDRAAELMQ